LRRYSLAIILGVTALIFSSLLSCQSKQTKTVLVPAPPNAKTELAQAINELNKGHEKSAVAKFKKLAQNNPGTDVADTSWTLIGRVFYKHKDFKSAATAYLQVLNGTTQTAHEEEAYLNASRSLTQLGRADEALSLSQKALASGRLTPTGQLELQKLRYPLLRDTGDIVSSLRALVVVYDNEQDPAQKLILKNKAFEMANKLQKPELENVVSNSDFGFVRGFAAFRLGSYFIEQHDYERARTMFQKTQEFAPDTNIASQAANYLNQIDSRKQVDAYMIGAVLPLSGKFESIGKKSIHGLQLGLGIYGESRSSFRLALQDSESSTEEARKGVETLVADDHPIAIVGSLMSRTAVPVATKANELGVPSIALSQKAGITESGTTVFRNAVTSAMQVKVLVKTAMEDLGMKKFAILFPNDAYGVEFSNLFWTEVEKRGGTIVGAQPYNSSETDFRAPVKRLVGTYYLEDRQAEYKKRVTDWFKAQKVMTGRKAPPDDLLPPIVDFDALFVPDGPKAMGQIAPMLAYVGVEQMKFLGTNLWNSDEFVRRGQKRVENALFVDAQVTSDPRFANSKFFTEYKATFGSEPGMFELQGYETGKLLRQLIEEGERSRLGLADRLARLDKIQGVLGPMQMSPERELLWPMTAFTVTNGAIVPFTKPRTAGL
jgi:branched-chain amino acid transport system substrate-binding protein